MLRDMFIGCLIAFGFVWIWNKWCDDGNKQLMWDCPDGYYPCCTAK